ncbi:MAG: right-handed parallel beta-helix repeat-containing protein [Candidatus Thermoplasmatota archaeon]|nr:right-handed parallel beta-helix repeat-containing protein [Candidatus Thermoplasmatota archaeon]
MLLFTTVLTIVLHSVNETDGRIGDLVADTPSLSDSPPMSIDGDVSLFENATLNGWPGTGTPGDPIVINGMDFDSSQTAYAVSIVNTTMQILMQNCTFRNTSIENDNTISGLRLMNNSKISVIDCNFTGTRTGIYALNSLLVVINSSFISNIWSGIWAYGTHCVIIDNMFMDQQNGVYVQYGAASSITGNNFTKNRQGIYLEYSDGTSIENNVLLRHDSNALSISYSNDMMITNNTYTDNDVGSYLRDSDHASIQNGTFNGNRLGVILMRCLNMIMINSTIRECSSYGVYVTSSSTRCNITRNHVSNCLSGVYFGGTPTSSYNYIHENTIENCIQNGIYIYGNHQYNHLVGNIINHCPTGIRCYNSQNNYFRDNQIDNSAESGVLMYYASSCTIGGNRISNSLQNGVSIMSSNGNTVDNNDIMTNTVSGIYLENSDQNRFLGNEIAGSKTGIENTFSDGSTVQQNHISKCVYGITFRGGDRAVIGHNTLLDCSLYGLTLSESNGNIITNNTIQKSKFHGLNLISSSDNLIYNNALAYNNKATVIYNTSTLQAQDNFDSNSYHQNGKGNFWRDLTGPDMNSDGIVDSPYQISGLMNKDPYPLISTEFKLVPSPPIDPSSRVYPGSASISWQPPEEDGGDSIIGYNVYRKNSTGQYLLVATKDIGSTEHMDPVLVNGETYTYYIAAYNSIGEGADSEKVAATPDDSRPVVEILTPSEGSYVNEKDVIVTWRSSDIQNNIIEYWVRLDDLPWSVADPSRRMTIPVVDNGPHTIRVQANDEAGNSNVTSVNFTMDREIPELSLIGPSEGSWTNDTSIYVSWSMLDLFSGIHHVEAKWDDVYWIDKDLSTDMTIKNLLEGPHTIYIKVIDLAGNSVTKMVNTSIDIVAPEVWIEYPGTGHLTNDPDLWFKWVGMDLYSGTGTFKVRVDEQIWNDVGMVYNTTVHLEEEGQHNIQLMVLDNAGNFAITSIDVILDTTIPSIIEYGPINSSLDPEEVRIFARISEYLDQGKMVFTINGVTGDITWTIDKEVVLTPRDGLRYGTRYQISISGEDLAGNKLEPFTWNFTTDNRGYLKGRILDVSNFPIKTAIVTISGADPVKVDGAGNFQTRVTSGAQTVLVEAPGFVSFFKEVVIKAGETYDLGPIRLEEYLDHGTIDGRVVDRNGGPLLGVIVTLDDGNTETTSENGRFQFIVEVGNYTISFYRDGYNRVVREVEVKKNAIIDLGDIELILVNDPAPSNPKGLELWQLQLVIFLVILVVGMTFIYFILRGARGRRGGIEEE